MDVDLAVLPEQDLADSIKGMYRLLDLISEQGSGGLGELLKCEFAIEYQHVFSGQNHYRTGLSPVLCQCHLSGRVLVVD